MIVRARIASVQNNGYNIFTEIRDREDYPVVLMLVFLKHCNISSYEKVQYLFVHIFLMKIN